MCIFACRRGVSIYIYIYICAMGSYLHAVGITTNQALHSGPLCLSTVIHVRLLRKPLVGPPTKATFEPYCAREEEQQEEGAKAEERVGREMEREYPHHKGPCTFLVMLHRAERVVVTYIFCNHDPVPFGILPTPRIPGEDRTMRVGDAPRRGGRLVLAPSPGRARRREREKEADRERASEPVRERASSSCSF